MAAALAAAAIALRDAPAEWLSVPDHPGPVDAALVLSGDPGYERTRTAAALVRSGRARLLVVTGAETGPGDSAVSLRAEAVRLGVPEGRIRMETVSRNTRESLLAVRPVLEGEKVERVLLVTSPYHQRRALLAARRALPGMQVGSHAASPSFWSPRGWWRGAGSRRIVLSEYGKLVYYACRGWI